MNNGERADLGQAQELLEQRDFKGALNILTNNLNEKTDGEEQALLALVYYHLEDYPSAVEHYSAALQFNSEKKDWQEMLRAANSNVVARVNVFVPEKSFFDRDTLLAKPDVKPPDTESPGH